MSAPYTPYKQLHVICEGPTETGFCKQVLEPYLFPSGEGSVKPISFDGVRNYPYIQKFVSTRIKQYKGQENRFTSMIDLYKLPKDFPGKATSSYNKNNPTPYVEMLEKSFEDDIDDPRFIPYLQLHEYETLLFADPDFFNLSFDNPEKEIKKLHKIADGFSSIEHINDNHAPSKRIEAIFPKYKRRKADAGPIIAKNIGIDKLCKKSPHFKQWLIKLNSIWD